jgi:hypothetical protein
MAGGKFMAWLLALIGILAIIGLTYLARSNPTPQRQQVQNQTQPDHSNRQVEPEAAHGGHNESNAGATPKKEQNYWERFVIFIEANDKFVTAMSTAVIAAFTVALFIATFLLWHGAEVTAERQLRAYIGIHAMEVTVAPFAGGGFAFIARAELRNFGQTPAYEVVVQSNAAVDLPEARPFGGIQGPAKSAGSAIAFKDAGMHVSQGWQISEADANAIRDRTKSVFLWGTVKYRDAFRKEHFFTFRLINAQQINQTIYAMAPHPMGYEGD